MKKKFMVLMSMLFVVLALGACGSKKASPVVGTWKITKAEAAGVSMAIDEYLAAVGMEGTKVEMILKDDNTLTMDMLGTEGEGTWEYKEPTLTLKNAAGDPMTATYEDGKLTMESAGVTLVFEK